MCARSYQHVLLVYRHADAAHEAHGNPAHVALGLFRNVPQSDLELLLPHMVVRMPELQRGQFIAMGAVGLWAASPLLFQYHALSYTGLVTLYTVGALAVRTVFKWRVSKQLYQQLLFSYQHKNRVGSSDGALLCASRLAEEEQTKQALTMLHTLLTAPPPAPPAQPPPHHHRDSAGTAAVGQQPEQPPEPPEPPDGRQSSSTLRRAHARVLRTWSECEGIECHLWSDWRLSALAQLLAMGVVERVGLDGAASAAACAASRAGSAARVSDAQTPRAEAAAAAASSPDSPSAADEVWVRLRPLEEAAQIAEEHWRQLGDSALADELASLDHVRMALPQMPRPQASTSDQPPPPPPLFLRK